MNKHFTDDSLFKLLWSDLASTNLGDDITIKEAKYEDIYHILNLIKASLVSNVSFTDCFIQVCATTALMETDEEVLKRLTFAIAFRHLLALNDTDIVSFIRPKRDFLAELAAQKYNIHIERVTTVEKEKLITEDTSNYSITDPPVPSWDEYFFNVCRQAARHSKCRSRRIGAILVKDKSIVSTGYNGPPRGVPSCENRWVLDSKFIDKYKSKIVIPIDNDKPSCPRYNLGAKSGEMLQICIAGHAEENAILNAAWHGISTKGATLYMTCAIPCFRCLIKIINAGISEIVVTGASFYDDNSEFLLNNSKVKVRFYDFLKKM